MSRGIPAGAEPHGVRAALLRYRVLAYLVGVGLAVLVFVGVPLQYAAGTPQVVQVVGPVHGTLYVVYLLAGADLARRARLGLWQLVAIVTAGFLPLLAFVVERRITRRVAAAPAPPMPGRGPAGAVSRDEPGVARRA